MADQQFKIRKYTEGDTIPWTESDKSAGVPVQVGGIVGITRLSIDVSEQRGDLHVGNEVYEAVKVTGSLAKGDPLYWDATGSPVGGTASSGAATKVPTSFPLGWVSEAAVSGATAVRFLKTTASPPMGGASVADAITDPGNAGAIPVTASGRVPIVTAGAETRTLAAPTAAGQELLIYMKTDGGDCVITCATGINQTGNNTITMNDAGDSIRLVAIESGSNLRWRVVVNDGCTLSTV